MPAVSHRLSLHTELVAIFPGTPIVFRPPVAMTFTPPYVIYDLVSMPTARANSKVYSVGEEYSVTVISQTPGLEKSRNILQIQGASHKSSFIKNDLVHDTYRIYKGTVRTR